MILVDTSVWVEHLRRGLPRLATLLQEGEVLIHPWVVGELACGSLRNRSQVLDLLQGLCGQSSQLGIGLTGSDFDIKPALELGLFTPEVAHFGQGVPLDQGRETPNRPSPNLSAHW